MGKSNGEMVSTVFLLLCVVLLGVAMLFAWQHHASRAVATPLESGTIESKEFGTLDTSSVSGDLGKLSAGLKDVQHKIWILGVVTNNNFRESLKYLPNAELICIQKDWSVDKVPSMVVLSEEEKQEIGNPPTGR